MNLSGRTRQLVEAYIEQWHWLFRRPGPELACFYEHVHKRILLDDDPPHIRQGLCLVGMTMARELADAGKQLGHASAANHEEMFKLFLEIAEGPEVTLDADDTSGQIVTIRFQDGMRIGYDPSPTEIQPQDVTWRFRVGPPPPQRLIGKGYKGILGAEGTEWFDLIGASGTNPGAVVGPWMEMFDRVTGRVLFSSHCPVELRRGYAAFAHVLIISLESFLDQHGYSGPRPLTRETSSALRDVFGQLSDGGSLSCSAFCKGSPIFAAEFDHNGRTSADHAALDHEALAVALRSVQAVDVELQSGPSLPNPKPRSKPRPNEPCSCGSGKKYKKCCGLH